MVERGEKLEMFHEPGLVISILSPSITMKEDSLDPSLCLAERSKHFQIPIRKGVFDALLREYRIIRSHVVPLSRGRQFALSKLQIDAQGPAGLTISLSPQGSCLLKVGIAVLLVTWIE